MSTIEPKYIAASEAFKEAIWLTQLAKDLGIPIEMPTLHCNSRSAIMLVMFHAKTKHIEVKFHFIWDMLEDKSLHLVKVHIDENLANLLTKGLPPKHCQSLMGVE